LLNASRHPDTEPKSGDVSNLSRSAAMRNDIPAPSTGHRSAMQDSTFSRQRKPLFQSMTKTNDELFFNMHDKQDDDNYYLNLCPHTWRMQATNSVAALQ
jgi:hypothetical protein